MNRRALALAFAALIAAASAWAQEGAADQSSAYRIVAVEYRIDGKTRERPLRDALEIKIGKEFTDLASLEAYVADRRQVLVNQRVLESADLTYKLGEAQDGIAPVTLIVTAKDTWNIIVLPYPKYTTNTGLLLGLRLRNYNFLGSMETLNGDFDYRYDENGDSSFKVGTEFTLPFELAGLDWSVNTDQAFALDFSGLPTYTDENTLKLYLHGDRFLWTFRVGQNLYWNADGKDDEDKNKLVLQSLAGVGTEVALFSLRGIGPVTLTPDLEAGWRYRADGSEISADRRGPYVTASYTFDAGRDDWVGNFRRGLVLQFYNAYTYNFNFTAWAITLKAQASYFDAWSNRVGLNSRLTLYRKFSASADNDIGSYLRGIPDDDLDGDLAAFANLDLPVRLFEFKPSLLIKKDWLDFEVHASPFVDAGVARAYTSETSTADTEIKPCLTGGLELFGFLKRARSIYARLSVGIDILGYLDTRSLSDNHELFFGLGHDY